MYRIQYIKKQIQVKKWFFSNIEEYKKKINIDTFTWFYQTYYWNNPIIHNTTNGKTEYPWAKPYKNKSFCPKWYIEPYVFSITNDENNYDFWFYDFKSCMIWKVDQEEETLTELDEDNHHIVKWEIEAWNYRWKTFYFWLWISKVSNGIYTDEEWQDYDVHNIYVFFLNKGRINMREYANDIVQKYLSENLIWSEKQVQFYDESKVDTEKLEEHLNKLTALTVTKEIAYTNNPWASKDLQIKLILTSKDKGLLKPIFDWYKLYKWDWKSAIESLPELYHIMEWWDISASYEEKGHEKSIRWIRKKPENWESVSLIWEFTKDIDSSEDEIDYDLFREKCISYVLNDEND